MRWLCIRIEYDYVLKSWNAVDVEPDIVGRYFMSRYRPKQESLHLHARLHAHMSRVDPFTASQQS